MTDLAPSAAANAAFDAPLVRRSTTLALLRRASRHGGLMAGGIILW